jgi:hypothetical protein
MKYKSKARVVEAMQYLPLPSKSEAWTSAQIDHSVEFDNWLSARGFVVGTPAADCIRIKRNYEKALYVRNDYWVVLRDDCIQLMDNQEFTDTFTEAE